MNTEIQKEAGVLRIRLQSGSLNINELSSFLKKVEGYTPPSFKQKSKQRFLQQLNNLDRGHARKPFMQGALKK